jgi:hypothetical protein
LPPLAAETAGTHSPRVPLFREALGFRPYRDLKIKALGRSSGRTGLFNQGVALPGISGNSPQLCGISSE